MKRTHTELPPEEWAFFSKEKAWLEEDCQHCWIRDEDLIVAKEYEYTRENFKRGGELMGYGLRGDNFKELMKIPFVSLSREQKDRIYYTERENRGVYGDGAIMLRKGTDPPNEWVYPLFINWNHKDTKILAAFKRFLELNRSELSPPENERIGGSGKKTTERDWLKYLAAYRLKETFGPKVAIETAWRHLKCNQDSKAFYTKETVLIEFSDRAKQELLTLWRFNQMRFGF